MFYGLIFCLFLFIAHYRREEPSTTGKEAFAYTQRSSIIQRQANEIWQRAGGMAQGVRHRRSSRSYRTIELPVPRARSEREDRFVDRDTRSAATPLGDGISVIEM
ncbi:uncharacterized protein LOC143186821 [Calliopsis andreniformis]|uniref:uncharacterized protein LOC143186821 n=1 Tax=Calliopsis andreniformis TaxID=337506 RepID=UPI003FCC6833